MSIVYSDDSDIIYWPSNDLHDPQSSKYYFLDYRPDVWQSNKPYISNVDVVIPVVANGCMYECISGGVSSSTTPTFITLEGRTFKDSEVLWRVIPFSARLGYGDSISTSVWTATSGVIITSDEITNDKTTAIKVTSVPEDLLEFELTNIIEVNRATGRVEKFKKTLKIQIGRL